MSQFSKSNPLPIDGLSATDDEAAVGNSIIPEGTADEPKPLEVVQRNGDDIEEQKPGEQKQSVDRIVSHLSLTASDRMDSFGSLSVASSPGAIGSSFDLDCNKAGSHPQAIATDRAFLYQENSRLKKQVKDCLEQIALLQEQLLETQNAPDIIKVPLFRTPKQTTKDTILKRRTNDIRECSSTGAIPRPVVLELPESLKLNTASWSPNTSGKSNFCPPFRPCGRSSSVDSAKEDRSASTSDGQETVGPDIDLDAHLSSSGLHHRNTAVDHQTKRVGKLHYTVIAREDHDFHDHSVHSEVDGLLRTSERSQRPVDDVEGSDNDLELGFFQSLQDRAGWLVGLLVLQSMSSFILARNEALLEKHLIIVQFLTMLVGAGGNAGNQASVRVIRGLAVGTIRGDTTKTFLRREILTGVCLSVILGVSGCIRAAIFSTPILETFAITSSLFMIVMISIVLGALLPLGMNKIGLDPAHSSTTIQVIMDILGVSITVAMSQLVLDSGLTVFLTDLLA